MTKTAVLPHLKGKDIKKPGKYVCLPVTGYPLLQETQDVWIVEVYESQGFLVYVTPTDNTERTVNSCGHAFYPVPLAQLAER